MRITYSFIAMLGIAMLAFTLLACDMLQKAKNIVSFGKKTDVDFSIVLVKGSNGEYQYVDLSQKGKIIINPQFSEAYIFRDGLALVKTSGEDGKYGYIDKKGKYVIPPFYDYAQDFGEGMAWVQLENQPPMLIDKKGKMLVQIDSLVKAYPFNNDMATVFFYSKGNVLGKFINQKGENAVIMAEGKFRSIINDDLYAFQSKGSEKWGYRNKKGETIINEHFDMAASFFDGVAVVKVGNKWGSINKKGDFIVNAQYDDMIYDSDGLYYVKVGKKLGWINKKGEVAINPQFDDLLPFYGNKLAPVKMGNKWAYADREGQIAINPQFDFAMPFFGDYAAIANMDNGVYKMGFINKKGDFAVPPLYDVGNDDFKEYTYSVGQKKFGLPIWYYFELGSDEEFLPYEQLNNKKLAQATGDEAAKEALEQIMKGLEDPAGDKAAKEALDKIMKGLDAPAKNKKSDVELAKAELAAAAKKWQKDFKAASAGTFFTFKAGGGEEGYSWKATSTKQIGDCPAKSVIEMGYEGCERWNNVPAKCKALAPKEVTSYKGDSGC